MTELAIATLQRLTRVGRPAKNRPAQVTPDGAPLAVQFNPASLRIARTNNVDRAGATVKTQAVQNPSAQSAKLTFDLEFDTAEQTSAGKPIDVRRWTAVVRQFVEPPAKRTSQPAPAVQFVWGTLIFSGIVDQVTEELDYFHADGTPLHAKVNVSITEQNFGYEAVTGPAIRGSESATEPGQQTPGTRLGGGGASQPEQIARANEGESVQQALSRLGLDPAAWRGAMQGLDSPLDLPAGANLRIGAEVRAGAGLGARAQFAVASEVSATAGLAGALGVSTSGSAAAGGSSVVEAVGGSPAAGSGSAVVAGAGSVLSAGASGGAKPSPQEAGFLLTAAGGIEAAVRAVQVERTTAAAQAERTAFEAPKADVILGRAADRRSLGYGAGLPLRARANPATLAAAESAGRASVAARARPDEVPSQGLATPPWVSPPANGAAARTAARQRSGDAAPPTLRWRPGGECR
jgi:hypothetical protein